MLINDYTIQNTPFKNVDMLTSMLELLVIKAMPAQRGAQRAVDRKP